MNDMDPETLVPQLPTTQKSHKRFKPSFRAMLPDRSFHKIAKSIPLRKFKRFLRTKLNRALTVTSNFLENIRSGIIEPSMSKQESLHLTRLPSENTSLAGQNWDSFQERGMEIEKDAMILPQCPPEIPFGQNTERKIGLKAVETSIEEESFEKSSNSFDLSLLNLTIKKGKARKKVRMRRHPSTSGIVGPLLDITSPESILSSSDSGMTNSECSEETCVSTSKRKSANFCCESDHMNIEEREESNQRPSIFTKRKLSKRQTEIVMSVAKAESQRKLARRNSEGNRGCQDEMEIDRINTCEAGCILHGLGIARQVA